MKQKLLLFVVGLLFMWGVAVIQTGFAYNYPTNTPSGLSPNYSQVDTVNFKGVQSTPLPPPDSGVQFSTSSLCPPNHSPCILITCDTSVFLCNVDSVRIWIHATDPDEGDTITIDKVFGMGAYTPKTGPSPLNDKFYFHPDTSGVYTFIFRAKDKQGASSRDTTHVTVRFNRPPVLTCPNNGSVHAGNKFTSSSFSVTDPDGGSIPVTLLNITPSVTNNPTIVASHVEWLTTCAEKGDYTIRLVVTDNCGVKDTCEFTVNVYNQPPVLTCPPNDSVKAGDKFVSSDYSVSDPDNATGITVTLHSISPTPTYAPTKVNKHVEWLTRCADLVNGPVFTITLIACDPCGAKDTCQFTVTVYNPPPVINCPKDDSIHAGNRLVSTDFSTSDPKCELVTVTLCGITPSPVNQPIIVQHHVEWQTACGDAGKLFTICLLATDSCGSKDTCYFNVKVYNRPPDLTCPNNDSLHAGNKFVSTNFSFTDPDGDQVTVNLCGITPTPTNQPSIVSSHVEWQTACADAGKTFTICLVATDNCGAKDTCYFQVKVRNLPPDLTCPNNDSLHAGNKFVSTNFSYTDPDGDQVTVNLCGITPTPVNQPSIVSSHVEWQTACADAGKTFTICLVGTDNCGAKDTCYFQVKVYNQPPVLTCPENDSTKVGDLFISNNYSVTDPDDPTGVTVTLSSVSPTPTFAPIQVGQHFEWHTCCADLRNGPNFVFTLIASDPCGAKDTCQFTVTVYNLPPVITCPEDDSVHAKDKFISTDFSASDQKRTSVTVTLCGITPTPVNQPIIVQHHVEWQTACADAGKTFTFCCLAEDSCGAKDTCYFHVTVYNRAPELTCPDNGMVNAGETFVSSEFSVTDPDGDVALVTFLSIVPPAINNPTIVGNQVEWITSTNDKDGDYTICLLATDPCGLADTCCFVVTVVSEPTGGFECPEDGSILAGMKFISAGCSFSGPGISIDSLRIISMVPTPTHQPVIVQYHVEWQTDSQDANKMFTICLEAKDNKGNKDTCCFQVSVYCHPPSIICPANGYVTAGQNFVSYNNFYVSDPDSDILSVFILDINPTPHQNYPVIVGSHIEWATSYLDEGEYVIRLVASDQCGADTCAFIVTVYSCHNPNFLLSTSPDTQLVNPGQEADYWVKLTSIFGLHQPCTLSVAGLPNPSCSGAFNQVKLIPTDSTILHVYTSTTTPTGLYPLTITAKTIPGGGPYNVTHVINVILKVVQQVSDVDNGVDNPNAPKTFTLFQNRPNPFNPETEISYYIPQACQVRLTIYNLLGQTIRTLCDGYQEAGIHTLIWDGKDNGSGQLSSGIYFYRLQAGEFYQTKKMSLLK